LRPAYSARSLEPSAPPPPLNWVSHSGGICDIGHEGEGFAFDNEGPRHQVLLRPFELASRLVTNGEYLAFMNDGGYRRPELWLSDGWDMVRNHAWNAPLYWSEDGNGWVVFTCHGVLPLDPHE